MMHKETKSDQFLEVSKPVSPPAASETDFLDPPVTMTRISWQL